MMVAMDVAYSDTASQVGVAAFESWDATAPAWQDAIQLAPADAYEPGQFFKRELPKLLQAIEHVRQHMTISTLIVDGYVWLDEHHRPGLGGHLYAALDQQIPVVGVAKNAFTGADRFAECVFRGESKHPLYVTAAGVEACAAAKCIQEMAGRFRMPDILKLADQLSRR